MVDDHFLGMEDFLNSLGKQLSGLLTVGVGNEHNLLFRIFHGFFHIFDYGIEGTSLALELAQHLGKTVAVEVCQRIDADQSTKQSLEVGNTAGTNQEEQVVLPARNCMGSS